MSIIPLPTFFNKVQDRPAHEISKFIAGGLTFSLMTYGSLLLTTNFSKTRSITIALLIGTTLHSIKTLVGIHQEREKEIIQGPPIGVVIHQEINEEEPIQGIPIYF